MSEWRVVWELESEEMDTVTLTVHSLFFARIAARYLSPHDVMQIKHEYAVKSCRVEHRSRDWEVVEGE